MVSPSMNQQRNPRNSKFVLGIHSLSIQAHFRLNSSGHCVTLTDLNNVLRGFVYSCAHRCMNEIFACASSAHHVHSLTMLSCVNGCGSAVYLMGLQLIEPLDAQRVLLCP